MYFNSSTFLLFLIIVLFVFWKTAQKSRIMGNWVLLLGSYFFYGWWDWRFLILIILSSTIDFILGKQIYKTENSSKRKFFLAISICVNIGILLFFKYFNFFVDSFKTVTGIVGQNEKWDAINIILPVGISFYTFQTLSYTIDIYKRKIKPTNSALTFFTFVAFFPQLVAGPIERAKRLLPQFEGEHKFSFENSIAGLKLMLWGFFKKMVIADQLATVVDMVYNHVENYSAISITVATFLFGIQIYCDFSGYSDIAIGTARLFGKELMFNFRTPYFSSSFREFWHRWHISLSTWFRDYMYIPLGGSRKGARIWVRNILITFTVSGLWHGANVTFVIWGFLHGLLLIAEKYIAPLFQLKPKLKKTLGFLITYTLSNVLWLFFRAESWEHLQIIKQQFLAQNTENSNSIFKLFFTNSNLSEPGRMLLFILPFFILIEFFIGKKTFSEFLSTSDQVIRWGFYYILILAILFFGVLNAAPQFIYFQF